MRSKLDSVITIFISFLVVSSAALAYSLMRAER